MKRVDRKYVCTVQKLLRKKVFGSFSPIWYCPEKWSGLNRISHPHWVKIYVDHNGQIILRAKQKYEVLSATNLPLSSFFFSIKKDLSSFVFPSFSLELIHLYLVKSLMKPDTLWCHLARPSTQTARVKKKLTTTTITQTYIYFPPCFPLICPSTSCL